jgi:ubiquinone biosynthesis protein COQ9
MPDVPPDAPTDMKERLLDAALGHVPFEGWSEATFRAAATEAGVDRALARAVCPRGAVDLAVAYHRRGDAEMLRRLSAADLAGLRFRDRVALAVRHRIEAIGDREAARRGTALFALPHLAPQGARLIWDTADLIWDALGDTSDDINWYTKRATLSAVYTAALLYWLGDDSTGHQATWDFIDRRIDEVMRFEKFKAKLNDTPVLRGLADLPNRLIPRVRKPARGNDAPLPGSWNRPG